MNIQKFTFSILFVYIFRSEIVGFYGNFMFNTLGNGQAVFQSGSTSLYSQQQCPKSPMSLHLHQHLLLSLFFIIASEHEDHLIMYIISYARFSHQHEVCHLCCLRERFCCCFFFFTLKLTEGMIMISIIGVGACYIRKKFFHYYIPFSPQPSRKTA